MPPFSASMTSAPRPVRRIKTSSRLGRTVFTASTRRSPASASAACTAFATSPVSTRRVVTPPSALGIRHLDSRSALRLRLQPVHGIQGDDVALDDDRVPVAQAFGLLQIVGGQERLLRPRPASQRSPAAGCAAHHVKASSRLVEEDQRGGWASPAAIVSCPLHPAGSLAKGVSRFLPRRKLASSVSARGRRSRPVRRRAASRISGCRGPSARRRGSRLPGRRLSAS